MFSYVCMSLLYKQYHLEDLVSFGIRCAFNMEGTIILATLSIMLQKIKDVYARQHLFGPKLKLNQFQDTLALIHGSLYFPHQTLHFASLQVRATRSSSTVALHPHPLLMALVQGSMHPRNGKARLRLGSSVVPRFSSRPPRCCHPNPLPPLAIATLC